MNWAQFLLTIVSVGSILAVLTLVLNLQYGHAGMINFGLVAYFAAGAYTYVLLTEAPPSGLDSYVVGLGWPAWAGFLGAGVAGVIFAIITGWPSLRLRGEYLALTTFAFAEVFHSFIVNERRFANGTRGMVSIPNPLPQVDFLSRDQMFAITALAFLAITFFLFQRLVRSPYGRALEAMRDDEIAFTSSGKDVGRFRLQVFLFTALFAGFAGAIYVWYTSVAVPDVFTAEVTFIVWIALILGGEGSNWGAVVGMAIIVAFEELVRAIPFSTLRAAQVAAALEGAMLGLLLIVFLRWQPLQHLWDRVEKRTLSNE